jgi:ABC-2 type transport system permease protein
VTLLDVERMKLFSTRSPWWCLGLIALIMVGLSALISALAEVDEVTVGVTLVGYNFALMVLLVMAAIAVTNEYRFGTIRATFTAVPNRTAVLLAKTGVVALVVGIVGEVLAFAAYGVARVIEPNADLAINSAPEWRFLFGIGVVFALSAVIAIAVGTLVRQTAAAISILLVWTLLVESLIGLIPKVGDDIQKWMPWVAANHFLTAGNGAEAGEGSGFGLQMPYGPWGGLAYFAGIAVALLVVALVVAERRDA